MIGRPHGAHQGIGGPHGEVDGEHQAEHQQLGAGGPADIGQVHLHKFDDLLGQEIPQRLKDGRHVQVQQAQQGADEDQEGEDHKQQVKRQGRALDAHVMAQIPLDHQIDAPQEPIPGHRQLSHGSSSLLSLAQYARNPPKPE